MEHVEDQIDMTKGVGVVVGVPRPVFVVPGQDEPTYAVEFGAWNGAPHQQGWSCTCKDYLHRRAPVGAHCKHIRAVIERCDPSLVRALIATHK